MIESSSLVERYFGTFMTSARANDVANAAAVWETPSEDGRLIYTSEIE